MFATRHITFFGGITRGVDAFSIYALHPREGNEKWVSVYRDRMVTIVDNIAKPNYGEE